MEEQSTSSEQEFCVPVTSGSLVHLIDLPMEYRAEVECGYTSGWVVLDEFLQGIRMGELTVITADTGVGKTTFSLHLALNCALQGVGVWINSWEMQPSMVLRKLASIVLRKPMKLADFTAEDNAAFDTFVSSVALYVNPNTIGMGISTLALALRQARDRGVQVVVLDHLDYLIDTARFRERTHEAIEEVMRRLHELTFELQMHIILICHPRQAGNPTEEVGIHALKGSSSIKQYADNVLILHRCNRTDPSADKNKVKVRVAKNRMFGTEGNAFLYYQPLWDGFADLIDTPSPKSLLNHSP